MKRPAPGDWQERDGYSKQELVPEHLLEDDAMVEVVAVAPDDEVKPHRHDRTEEVFYILQEGGTLVIDGDAFTPERGEVIVCEPGEEHAVLNDSDQVFRILVVKLMYEPDDTVWLDDA
ncbi:MAG: cupin domain-containing protein [Candidatus Nanohaloarchaea archaeon]|nr:cupin domain-containing protein [Candidatus Nanohaloarchaea archaeon]